MSVRLDPTWTRRRITTVAAWSAAWSAYIALTALVVRAQEQYVPFRWALTSGLIEHAPVALLTPLLWWLAAAIHRRRIPKAAAMAIHVATGVFVVAATKGAFFAWMYLTVPRSVWRSVFGRTWMYQVSSSVVEFAALMTIILLLQARRRERVAYEVAREAEIAAARAQLHPHFMMNSLNSIVSLIESDPPRARDMVVRLSELLQATLRDIDDDMVPLSRELDIARAYLDIEQIRFGPRLRVSIDLDERLREAGVPPLLLQPIVENAVRHGIAPHARPGEVSIVAAMSGSERMRVEVHDSGDGIASAEPQEEGRGLELTRRRLDSTFPGAYSMSFDRSRPGFGVVIDVPVTHG